MKRSRPRQGSGRPGSTPAAARATSTETVLLADIGGTTARFALLKGGRLDAIHRAPVAAFARFIDALEACVGRRRLRDAGVTRAVLGVAGAVHGDRCTTTNGRWTIDAPELREKLGLAQVRLVNDFAALAWALPKLASTDVRAIGGGRRVTAAPAAVIGPGTGLGCACLAGDPDHRIVMESEGGHATLPGTCDQEDLVIAHLRSRFGHVSAERILSGSGLVLLYETTFALNRLPPPVRSPAEITTAALDGSCLVSRAAVDMFCALLGTFAGNVALTFGARGGVYIAGGIVPRLADYLARSQFRARFEAKGRLGAYVSTIPSYVVVHRDPAFLGLEYLANDAAPGTHPQGIPAVLSKRLP